MAKARESGMPDEAHWGSFFNPDCIVARLDCAGPIDVVEFGCGYGHFTIAAGKLVSGTVYALDIEPRMVEATAARAGLVNVVAEVRDFLAGGCGRPDGSVGYAMLFNILHVEEPVELLREKYRVLAPGGRASVIHWKHDPATTRGPSLGIHPQLVLAGSWKLVSSEVEGVPTPKDKLPAISMKLKSDGKSTGQTPDGEIQMSFVIDPAKTPKTVDIEHLSGPSKGQKQYGIYKVDGDLWTVLATPPGYKPKDRPGEFDSKNALGPLVVWERVKK